MSELSTAAFHRERPAAAGAWALVAFFMFCLVPLSVEGNSVNYAFVLLPLMAALTGIGQRTPAMHYVLAIFVYAFIGATAALYQIEFQEHVFRRVTSFALFVAMFAFVFMRIDAGTIDAFCRALVTVALVASLTSLLTFVALGGSELGFDAKDAVGGQRFGFIYVLAFWVLRLGTATSPTARLLKPAAIFVVLVGLLLTFSRASVVALAASFVLHAVARLTRTRRVSLASLARSVAVGALGTGTVVGLLAWKFPIFFEFFDVRLIEFLAQRDVVQGNLVDAETSEGTRIFIWGQILDFVARNPLTGSGFLGVWVLRLFDGYSGSAHNQYFDVLFRVGVVGFLIYAGLLLRIGQCLRRSHPGLFWGYVGILVYGLFHETFKESQGGFVLAFFVGMVSQGARRIPFSRTAAC